MNTEQKRRSMPSVLLPVPELNSVEGMLNPFPWFASMRKKQPIRFDEKRDCWDVFKYEDVQTILKDYKTFSAGKNHKSFSSRPEGNDENRTLSMMDPPKHTELRSVISKAFTNNAILNMESSIQRYVDDILNKVSHDVDLISEIAVPLPVIVIAELLGIPKEDQQLFKEWSDGIVSGPEDESPDALKKAIIIKKQSVEAFENYVSEIIEDRKENPKEDIITKLVQAEENGIFLEDQEILGFCLLLLAAGNETTTNLIGNSIRILLEDKCLLEELKSNLDLVESFIEEVLRYYPPLLSSRRKAVADINYKGNSIKAGDEIVCWIGSGNHDENVFIDSGSFLIDRKNNKHLTFGFGNHYCLGASLARLEVKVILSTLIKRYDIKAACEPLNLIPIKSHFVFGLKDLKVKLEKR